MKTRTVSVVLALLAVLHVPFAAAFAGSASARVRESRRESVSLAVAAAATQTQAGESARPGQQRPAPSPAKSAPTGTLFENVLAVLQKRYYDERFRVEVLPKLAAQFAEKARRATTLSEQRGVVQELLSHIPASHLGLLSKQSYRYVMSDLQGRAYPTFGFQLIETKGKLYAFFVLEDGPAERAGLLAWDRVVSIDGVPTQESPRLEWRTDDAYIPDERDPAVHYLTAVQGDTIRVKVERRRNEFVEVSIAAAPYSAFAAAKASARVYKTGGRRIGYLHFWYVHMTGVPELLKEKLEGDFGSCDALVLDLRGRGGNGLVISQIIDILRADNATRHRPIVALVDRQSRSAKDVLAYELKRTELARIVGERTAGAVIPATFADVGHDTMLMFPSFKLARYTDLLELKPVEPDLFVERAGPLSAGNDPILKAGLDEAVRLAGASVKWASAR